MADLDRLECSHSMGLILFIGGSLALGKAYFFSVPFAGIGISLACYVASIAAWRA